MSQPRQIAVLLFLLYAADSASDESSLFTIQESSAVRGNLIDRFLDSHYVKKYSIVTIDVNRLREEIRSASQLPDVKTGRSLTIDLFDDFSYDFQPSLVQDESNGLVFWSGSIESNSEMIASVGLQINWNDEVEGNFRTAIGRIRVEPTEELPFHIVWLQDYEAEQEGRRNDR